MTIEEWRWYPEDPEPGYKSTMDVIVPEKRKVQQPFGFARFLAEDKVDPYKNRRCIGCGRFLKKDADWNQCADCDTRSYDY